MRSKQKEEMQDRADKLDDLRGLEDILGSSKKRYERDSGMQLAAEIENKKFSKSLNKFVSKKDMKSLPRTPQSSGMQRPRDQKAAIK
jgi:hypothetical protein